MIVEDTAYDIDGWAYLWGNTTTALLGAGNEPTCDLDDQIRISYRIDLPLGQAPGTLRANLFWRVTGGQYTRGGVFFDLQTGTANYVTFRQRLRDLAGVGGTWGTSWLTRYAGGGGVEDLERLRLDFTRHTDNGIRSTLNGGGYFSTGQTGTSQAAPHVTGIIALMLEHYDRTILQARVPRGDIRVDAFWNSTAKAILIHTATDLVKTTQYPGEFLNVDTRQRNTVYHAGPDFVTGWGMVNAERAIAFTTPARFREVDVDHQAIRIFKAVNPAVAHYRATIAWDDPPAPGPHAPADAYTSKLVNNLDLAVMGPDRRTVHRPWVLPNLLTAAAGVPGNGVDNIPAASVAPATRGVDNVNNVEVVDIANAPVGEYTIVVTGTAVPNPRQNFSVVSEQDMTEDLPSADLINGTNSAVPNQVINMPAATYDVVTDASVPAASGNVTLSFAAGSAISLTPDAVLSLGTTGRIQYSAGALVGEWCTISYASNGVTNEIRGRADFTTPGSAPCGTVVASRGIDIANVSLTGCTRHYTAGTTITIGNGTVLGNGVTLRKAT